MTLKKEIEQLRLRIKGRFKDIFHLITPKKPIVVTKGNVEISKNVCVFCSFAPNGIKNTTWQYLKELKENGFSILLVSSAKIENKDIEKLKDLCFEIIERENYGGDFACYKFGILKYEQTIKSCESLLIANDSVIAPCFPLKEMFEEMNTKKCDFWGATEYLPCSNDSTRTKRHVASFFILFKPSVLSSETFFNFWRNYKLVSYRKSIIRTGEIALNNTLIRAGFVFDSFVNTQKVEGFIEREGLFKVFKKALTEASIMTFTAFVRESLDCNKQDDLKRFLLMQNKHKLQIMLLEHFRYPFIKKDILSKNFVNKFAFLDFLNQNTLNMQLKKEDIIKELK